MKFSYLFIAVCWLFLYNNQEVIARKKERINFDWKFKLGDIPDASKIDFNDLDWETLNLPHDASIYGPFVKDTLGGTQKNGYRPRHIGWYRKYIQIDKNLESKRVFLEFEGVYRASDVWVNGQHCGTFLNGYLDFQYDITSKIVKGNNIIAVRYDNTFKESSRWYTGEGITRDVFLHVTDEVHVSRYGTYITTPVITQEFAKVDIQTEVLNSSKDSILCRLVTDIISPSGKLAGTFTSVAPFSAGETYRFDQTVKVDNPHLWDIDNPQLYKAISKVYISGNLTDTYETNFGIRTVEFTNTQGFLLNGRKVFLKGVCLHHDLGPLGAASFESGWDKRLGILKDNMGCNAIRLSHNPYPKYVLDWCDKNGVLVFDEAYDNWTQQYYGPGNQFEDYWRSDLKTFIKRDRNHPSVFIWSVGNEVPQQHLNREVVPSGVAILKEMVSFVHQLEPTRQVTCALYPARYDAARWNHPNYKASEPHQMAFYMDVMSVNYMSGFFEKDREKYPQLIFLVSEMATGEAGYNYFEYDHSYPCGQFYWGGTEYIGESFGWPSKGWINGAIDLCNNFKPVGYSIKSFYNEKPMVQIAVTGQSKSESIMWNDARLSWKPMDFHWNWGKDESLTVQTFTNCDSVELLVNGKSKGIQTIVGKDKPEIYWDITYEEGSIEAQGIKNGNIVANQELKTAGKAHQVILEADKINLTANGLDLAYIKVKVVDKNGVLVQSASNKIDFSVTGEGINAGVGNGYILSDELWQADSRSVFKGECQLIIRSSRTEGEIQILANSEGLKSAKLVLTTINGKND